LPDRCALPTLGLVNWVIVIVAATAGLAAGIAARVVLGRMRRGVRVRAGPCEVLGAVLFSAIGARHVFGGLPAWWLPVPLVLSVLAVPLVVVDLARRRLPDALTLPAYGGLGLAIAAATVAGDDPLIGPSAVLGAGVFFGLHWLVHRAAPGSLGAGDVKLAGSVGGVLGAVGWPALAVAAVLGSLLTLVLAAAARVVGVQPWRGGVPHGPGLLTATWLVAVFPSTGSGVGPLA